MKRLMAAMLAIALLVPGRLPAGPPHEAASSPAAVATRLFKAFNRHDLAALEVLYAVEAELVSPDHAAPLRGPDAVRAIYRPLFARYPDLHDRVVSVTAEGDRVAVEFVSTGCDSGRRGCFTLPIASVLTVRDGRIMRDASYFDAAP